MKEATMASEGNGHCRNRAGVLGAIRSIGFDGFEMIDRGSTSRISLFNDARRVSPSKRARISPEPGNEPSDGVLEGEAISKAVEAVINDAKDTGTGPSEEDIGLVTSTQEDSPCKSASSNESGKHGNVTHDEIQDSSESYDPNGSFDRSRTSSESSIPNRSVRHDEIHDDNNDGGERTVIRVIEIDGETTFQRILPPAVGRVSAQRINNISNFIRYHAIYEALETMEAKPEDE